MFATAANFTQTGRHGGGGHRGGGGGHRGGGGGHRGGWRSGGGWRGRRHGGSFWGGGWNRQWWPQAYYGYNTYNQGVSYWQLLAYLNALNAQRGAANVDPNALEEAIADLAQQVAMLQGQVSALTPGAVVQQPQFVQPVLRPLAAPVYPQPVYGQPVYGQPVYQPQPAYGQPVYGSATGQISRFPVPFEGAMKGTVGLVPTARVRVTIPNWGVNVHERPDPNSPHIFYPDGAELLAYEGVFQAPGDPVQWWRVSRYAESCDPISENWPRTGYVRMLNPDGYPHLTITEWLSPRSRAQYAG